MANQATHTSADVASIQQLRHRGVCTRQLERGVCVRGVGRAQHDMHIEK